MNCESCGKPFKTIYTLKRHQTRTICGKVIQLIETNTQLIHVNNDLLEKNTTVQQLNAELTHKTEYLKEENTELRLNSRIYEEKYNMIKEDYTELKLYCNRTQENLLEQANKTHEKLLERATTKTKTNTRIQTIINNLAPLQLEEERVMKILMEKFDERALRAGLKGVGRILCRDILVNDDGTKMYCILDANRLHGGFITPDKKLVRDPHMKELIKRIHDPLLRIINLTIKDHHKIIQGDGEFTSEYKGYWKIYHVEDRNTILKQYLAMHL
jgi:hypothetical protein